MVHLPLFLGGEGDLHPAEGVHNGGGVGEVDGHIVHDVQAEVPVQGADGQLVAPLGVGGVDLIHIIHVHAVAVLPLDGDVGVPEDGGDLQLLVLVVHREHHNHIGTGGIVGIGAPLVQAEQGDVLDAVVHGHAGVDAQGRGVLGDIGGGQVVQQVGGYVDEPAAKDDEQRAEHPQNTFEYSVAAAVLAALVIFLGGGVAGEVLEFLCVVSCYMQHDTASCLT